MRALCLVALLFATACAKDDLGPPPAAPPPLEPLAPSATPSASTPCPPAADAGICKS